MTSGPKYYGLFLYFIGVFGMGASLLGGAFGLGMAYANEGLDLSTVVLLRDAVLGLVLGVVALWTGYHLRQGELIQLVWWEWTGWLVVWVGVAITVLAIVVASVGVEFIVFLIFYMLLAVSATSMRRKYCHRR